MAQSNPIEVAGLYHSFGQGPIEREILSDVDLTVARGEIVIVSGPSGSGKTTLLTLIGALRSIQSGSIRLLGNELRGASAEVLRETRKGIGFVFQHHNLIRSLSALQNVQMSLFLRPELSRKETVRMASDILERVGLSDHLDDCPQTLSAGQRQRVAVARALVSEPGVVLADEPTAALDRDSGREVVELICELARTSQTTVLVVTHDDRIHDVADRLAHLEDGRLSSTESLRNP